MAYVVGRARQRQEQKLLILKRKEGNEDLKEVTRELLFLSLEEDAEENEDDDGDVDVLHITELNEPEKSVENLLDKINSTVPSDATLWHIYADFQESLGRRKISMDARVRQFRVLLNEEGWEKTEEKISVLTSCGIDLVNSHRFKDIVQKSDLYSCKSMLQTAIKRIEEFGAYQVSKDYDIFNA